MADPLFNIRNNFHLGGYQTVVNEAFYVEDLSDAELVERDTYVYRSYIAQGTYELVTKEVKDSSAMALQAVKLLAQYLSGQVPKATILSTMNEWLTDVACNRNPTVLLMIGMIHAHEGNYVEALKCCHIGTTLEMLALCVQVYIKMDRIDKAESAVKTMVGMDDDATITQLAQAWLGVAVGGAKIQEALYIYQELGEKYNWTSVLHNGRAVCYQKQGRWEDSEQELLESLNRDAKDADTLANLIVAGLHLGKATARFSSQLKILCPAHPSIKRVEAMEETFSRAAASMA